MIRSWFQRLPIARKLRFVITAACVVVIFVTGIALMVAESLLVRQRMVAALTARARVLSLNATAAVMFHSTQDAEEMLRVAGSDPGTTAARIFDVHGEEFARFAQDRAEAPVPFLAVTEPHHEFTWRDLTVWMPMTSTDGRRIGTLAVRMSLDLIYDRLTIYAVITLGVLLAATALALVLSQVLQRVFSEPILALARAAGQVTTTRDFSHRVPQTGTDELGQLAESFNVMLATVQTSQAETQRLYEQIRLHARELEARVDARTAELQRAYRELEAFSYSVSHDLRSPLRSIAGFTEALLDDNSNQLSTDGMQYAQRIVSAVTRMNRLIDGLLDLSRVSKRELHLETIDLNALARDVIAELNTDAGGRNVTISIEPLTPCVGDSTLVRQVLVNLLSNALKYSRERDRAVISVSEHMTEADGELAYVVRDNGTGFDMRHAARLFQVFERLHDARQFEGTGIGLATSKRIIERHGGRIWAESAPDQGAAFFFTLPPPPAADVSRRARVPEHAAEASS
jgi:signal transduction histidine kinase